MVQCSLRSFAPRSTQLTILAAVLVRLPGSTSQLEVLGALDRLHAFRLADCALKLQHNLLGRLRLLVEHRLRLPSESRLLLVVPALSLCAQGGLAGLVLRDLVVRVLLALLAERVARLRDVHHGGS